jgi:exodeoxyribonuclease III
MRRRWPFGCLRDHRARPWSPSYRAPTTARTPTTSTGVNARLPNLVAWLKEAAPDVVCLQELKAPDEKFPATAIWAAGYGAIWHGQKSWNGVSILARGRDPVEIRRSLPGDPNDSQSRYIEAAIDGVTVGCLSLPNGNPAPGGSPAPAYCC